MRSNLRPPAFQPPSLPRAAQAHDLGFARDVLAGLAAPAKHLSGSWLYDPRGSALFETVSEAPAYYPTRTEILILRACVAQIAELAGPGATVIELGGGSRRKTPLLLAALDAPALYMPVDISAQSLQESVRELRLQFPQLPMQALVADFTRPLSLPARRDGRRVVFLPGPTIGKFAPELALQLLQQIGEAAGPGALLVLGADATQDPAVLLPAYDGAQGLTAAFNKNLLVRINRELGADFDPDAFRHEARFDALRRRVELHLVSECDQRVWLLGRCISFAAGESIHTDNSYKHGTMRLEALAGRSGWSPRQLWMAANSQFAVHVFESHSVGTP
jgi:L-histidine N-alpha-methyltransferase